jgi:hypothetical protein
VVHGVLYVDDFVDSLQFLSGSQLAALPYAYTIGLFIRLDDLDLDMVRTQCVNLCT